MIRLWHVDSIIRSKETIENLNLRTHIGDEIANDFLFFIFYHVTNSYAGIFIYITLVIEMRFLEYFHEGSEKFD